MSRSHPMLFTDEMVRAILDALRGMYGLSHLEAIREPYWVYEWEEVRRV